MIADQNSLQTENKAALNLNRLGVLMLAVFGSSATRVKKPADIDIAVFLNDEAKRRAADDFDAQFEILKTIADFMDVSPDDIDAVFMGPEVSPLLAYHIARDGKLLFGSEREFMRFRVYAVKSYQDTWKFREANRLYLKKVYA